MAVPVIESFTAIQEGTDTTSFSVTHPTGLAAGDLLLACIAKDDDIAMDNVTGWTRTTIAHTDSSINVFYKIATASDVSAGSTTFTGDSEQYVGRLYRISGADNTTPIDVIDTTGASGETAGAGSANSVTIPSVTTVTNDALAFVVVGFDDDDEPYVIDTGGWTTDFYNESINGSGVNGTAGIIVGYKSMATAGATGGCDVYQDAAEGYAGLQLAIRPSSGTAYTLTAAAGSYSVTGTAASLLATRKVTAAAGSYSVSGTAAGLLSGRKVTAAAGSYAITGTAAGLLATRSVTAGAGAYSVTGQAAGLLFGHKVTAAAGAYALTGQPAGLLAGRAVTADVGAYSISGTDASLLAARTLGAGAGAYSITGYDATLSFTILMAADSGTYAVTGQSASLLVSRKLTADPGSYTVTGYVASLSWSGEVALIPMALESAISEYRGVYSSINLTIGLNSAIDNDKAKPSDVGLETHGVVSTLANTLGVESYVDQSG